MLYVFYFMFHKNLLYVFYFMFHKNLLKEHKEIRNAVT
jgi:hypothetical protein